MRNTLRELKGFAPLVGGISAGLLVLGVFVFQLQQWQMLGSLRQQIRALPSTVAPEQRVELEHNQLALNITVFNALMQTIGGALLLVAAYVALYSLKTPQRPGEGPEAHQLTERFTQAINHLGSEQIEVRLGALYALERIAKESPQEHWTIMEILCAYVRERSPVEKLQSAESQPEPDVALAEAEAWSLQPVTTDVQTALTVIGRRAIAHDPPDAVLDFNHTKLVRANLSQGQFSNANFTGTLLRGANLTGACFRNAVFLAANLVQANLKEAIFSGALLSGAHLSEAVLTAASFDHASLFEVDLKKADLQNTDLSGATLSFAKGYKANFQAANLAEAMLNDIDLTDTNLRGASLRGADLRDAVFVLANLSEADFEQANLRDAHLRKANLTNAKHLTEAQLQVAKLCRTVLPEGTVSDRDC